MVLNRLNWNQLQHVIDVYKRQIYGHYPVKWKTQFIVDQLAMHPDWRICMEIEPETWDTVSVQTPEAYLRFKEMATVSYTHLDVYKRQVTTPTGQQDTDNSNAGSCQQEEHAHIEVQNRRTFIKRNTSESQE